MTLPNSNTFKCKSSNKMYTLLVTLFTDNDPSVGNMQSSLDGADIEEVSYESKLNDLLIKGKVIYIDKYAMVDKFIGQHFAQCEIMFAENKKKNDKDVGMGSVDKEKTFLHRFIISSIKVLQRNFSIIKYEINLISLKWINCVANINYSNYGKQPEPIFQIIRNCIAQNGLKIDDASFDRVISPVKMNYVTQRNDNAFTVVGNLLHKLYYWGMQRDDSMKFITYDVYDNSYKLIDIKDKSTFIGSYATLLSFFKSNIENLIQAQPTNIGSFVNPMEKPNVYANLFAKDMYTYDYRHDSVSIAKIPSDETVNYLNNRIGFDNYVQKYYKMKDMPGIQHKYIGSYWSNELDVYNEAVIGLEENNTFIVNITGEIRRQPGSLNSISIDRSLANITSDNKKELEKMKKKYKAFEGLWLASKVKSIIQPSNESFRQQVVLFRNFLPQVKAIQT